MIAGLGDFWSRRTLERGVDMVEGKTLTTFRDITIIIGLLLLCFLQMQAFQARLKAQREQDVRFAVARNASVQLDEAYKRLAANKSLNEQIFRQNEILIEYQKLILTIPFMPASVAVQATPGAAVPKGPAKP
jgi:hypothetical protein